MRIIDKSVTGTDLKDLAEDFFKGVCILNSDCKNYNAIYLAGKLQWLAADDKKRRKYYPVYKYLFDNLELLIKGNPQDLFQFDLDFKAHLEKQKKSDLLDKNKAGFKTVKKLFHDAYDSFRYRQGFKNYIDNWYNGLNLKTCPYCNRNWITKIKDVSSKNDKFYMDIDHYWPKGEYPWFAISFYNLIPSCTICNQRIKSNKELEFDKHIHPYVDDMHSYLKFSVPIQSVEDFFSLKKVVLLETIPRFPYTHKDIEYEKAKKTFQFFNLENFYNSHLDYVRELMQRDIVYSSNYIFSLLNMKTKKGHSVYENETDLLKMIVGNYVLPEHIHERPLAKLTQDILEDFTNRHYKMV